MRKRPTEKFIAFSLLMTSVIIICIWFITSDNSTKQQQQEKTAEYDTNFIAFCDRHKPDWLRMINSSLNTLDYFESHLHELVTDVAVGTRIMEAQINILIKTRPDLRPEIMANLKELQRKSNLVGDAIVQRYRSSIELATTLNETKRRLKENIKWIISPSTWETPAAEQWTTLRKNSDPIAAAPSVDMAVNFGPSSDGCIFGTFANCDIPDYCIDFMWREPHSGYLLTHQILFHYMIGRNGCFSGKKRRLYESQNLVDPQILLETMCRRVIAETRLIESYHHPDTHKDLFVEQILVCSLAGYNDFLTRNWTTVILDWSSENGVLGCYTSDSKKVAKRSVKSRVKRWNKNFQIGNELCSVHIGALTLGVIGQQLRYFLEMCYDL